MGYYVEILKSTFKIPAKNLDAAHQAMSQLNFTVPNKHKRGGSWPAKDKAPQYGPYQHCWFSWMDWNYHETCLDAQAILEALRFETSYNDKGELTIDYFNSKMGQESLFLDSLSPLAKGYIVWRGEGGDIWGETYGGEKVIRKEREESSDYSDIVTYEK